MSKILLLDTNFSSSPIYDYLIKNNNEVFIAGGNPNDFLAKSVKNYYNIDYSCVEKVKSLIDELKIDFLVPGCNDLSYQVCSIINSSGDFSGIDNVNVTETINNKEKFRIFAAENNIPIPRLVTPDLVGKIWPVIVKPVDAYSGRGITIVSQKDKSILASAVENATNFSRSKKVIIEEYIEGQLYSHTAFISGGKIIIDFIVEEHSTANPFVVDTSKVIYDLPNDMLVAIRKAINHIANELKLVDGLVHTQFIKKDNSFWIIEITRRCPGDLYSLLIEMTTGFHYAEYYAKPFLNQILQLHTSPLTQQYIIRHTITQSWESHFHSLKFNIPVIIEKLLPISLAGDNIKASPFGRIALLFLRTDSREEHNILYKTTLKRELYTIQECNKIN